MSRAANQPSEESSDDARQTAIDTGKIVTLDQLLAFAQRYPYSEPSKASDWGHQAALVDDQDRVLAVFDTLEQATHDLLGRMDADPCIVTRLQLVRVTASGASVWWPSEETALDRACRAADAHGYNERGAEALSDDLWSFMLRGEPGMLRVGDTERSVVELWWVRDTGERVTIGYLVEQQPGQWHLHACDELRPRPAPEYVEQAIAAQVRDALGNPDITAERVRALRKAIHHGETPGVDMADAAILIGLGLADRLDLLSRIGVELYE